jgi:hypothetical protein
VARLLAEAGEGDFARGERLDQADFALAIKAAAAEIGVAKPIPWAADDDALMIPMTLPDVSIKGPPLLPGLIAASVWTMPVRSQGWPVRSSATVSERSRPETSRW